MIFTKQQINKMVYPLIGQQILSISVGIIDSMMVSTAGEAAISGVSLIGVLNTLLMLLFSAFSSGGAIVLSHALGTKNMEKARIVAKQLLWSCFGVASIVTIITLAFRIPLLNLIYGKTDPLVMQNARDYFFYLVLAYPFLALSNGAYAIFNTMGNTKISFYNSMLTNFINIVCNALLIYVFKMGAKGAAIATAISWIASAVTMLYRLHNKKHLVYVDKLHKVKLDFGIIKNICSVGIPNGVENSMFQFGKVLTQSLIASFALSQITANSVANAVVNLQYGMGTALGAAMVTVVGRCIGAGEKEQAKTFAKFILKKMYFFTTLISLVICLLAKQITQIYNLSGETAAITIDLLIFHSIAAAVIWPSAFTMPSAFRAAKDVKFTMIVSVVSMWIFRVYLSYVLGRDMGLGVMGVWYAMICDWIFRAIVFVIRFIRGTWLKKYQGE